MSKNEQGAWYCGQCGTNFDEKGKPACGCVQTVEPKYLPTSPQAAKIPAGVGHMIIDLFTLEAMLDLPEGVQVHHTYPLPVEYGMGVGLILTSDQPGILPEYKRYERPEYLHCGIEIHIDGEGKHYFKIRPLLPKKD